MGKLEKPPKDCRLLEFADDLEEEDFRDEGKVKKYLINPLEDIILYLNNGSMEELILSIKKEVSLSQIFAFKECSLKEQTKLIIAYLIVKNKEGLVKCLKAFIHEAEEAFLAASSPLLEAEKKKDPGSTCLLVAEEKVREAGRELALILSQDLEPEEILKKAASIRKLILDSYEFGALSVLFCASPNFLVSREEIDKYETHRQNAADLRSSEEAFLNKLFQDLETTDEDT